MIAVVTNRDDLTADWLVLELERRTVPFVRINTEDYPATMPFHWALDGHALDARLDRLHPPEVTAVWWRRPQLSAPPSDRLPEEAAWALGEAFVAFEGFWAAVEAHWVNRPADNAKADCKPEQLLRADRLGWRVPASLITADADHVSDFASRHGRIVCKPLREGRVPSEGGLRLLPTVVLSSNELSDLSDLGPEPYYFQELVPKAYDVRVTVIGDEAYGCRIHSQEDARAAVDWRRGDVSVLKHEAVRLPDTIAARCIEITQSYGLRFAAIDLSELPNGEFVFFELNPNGQWAWIEHLTGLPLRNALVNELLRGTA